MNTNVRMELEHATRRTQRCVGVSVIAHLLLLSLLTLVRAVTPDMGGITEITWIDAVEPVAELPAAEPQPAAVDPVSQPITKPQPRELKFERPQELAELAPAPQDVQATQDKLN